MSDSLTNTQSNNSKPLKIFFKSFDYLDEGEERVSAINNLLYTEDVDIVLINFACLINKSIKKKNNEIFGFIEPNNYAKADINLDAVSYILPLYGSTCVSVFPPQEPTGRTQTVNKISLPFNTTMKILNTQWINSLVEAPGNVT